MRRRDDRERAEEVFEGEANRGRAAGGGGGGDEDGKRARSAATTPSPSAPWKMLKANAAADLGAILTETERRDMMSEVEDSHRPFVLSEVEKPPQRENKRVLRIRKPAMIRAPGGGAGR